MVVGGSFFPVGSAGSAGSAGSVRSAGSAGLAGSLLWLPNEKGIPRAGGQPKKK